MVPFFCLFILILHLKKEFIITFSEDISGLIHNVLILLQLCAELDVSCWLFWCELAGEIWKIIQLNRIRNET